MCLVESRFSTANLRSQVQGVYYLVHTGLNPQDGRRAHPRGLGYTPSLDSHPYYDVNIPTRASYYTTYVNLMRSIIEDCDQGKIPLGKVSVRVQNLQKGNHNEYYTIDFAIGTREFEGQQGRASVNMTVSRILG